MLTRKKTRKPPQKSAQRLTREILTLFLFAVGVFVLTSILTYHPDDPSLFSKTSHAASNACGWVGAYLSALFLHSLGMGAFFIPFSLFFLTVAIFRKESALKVLSMLAGLTSAVLSFTVFVSFHWEYWDYSQTLLLTGGAFGKWVSEILRGPFNLLGSSLISLTILILSLVVSMPLSVIETTTQWTRRCLQIIWKTSKWATTLALYFLGKFSVYIATQSNDLLLKVVSHARQKIKDHQISLPLTDAIEVGPVIPSDHEPQWISSDSLDLDEPSPSIDQESLLPEPLLDEEPLVTPVSSKPGFEPKILPREKLTTSSKKPLSRTKGYWKLPTLEFLKKNPKLTSSIDKNRLIESSRILKEKFEDFGITGEVTAVQPGPVITLFEYKPGPGIKVSKIAALADDLSMALSAESVRILAPLPGKSVVGIEVPSDIRERVVLRELLEHPDFNESKADIPIVMGKNIGGQPHIADLARMPHLLCAGQTGAGKSVFMNSLICSLLYRFTPDELKMILIDPKFIEFRSYQDIPHLLLPVVDDPKQASKTVRWAVREMERRYRILAMLGVRNLQSYNEKVGKMGDQVVHDLLVSEEKQESQNPRFSNMSGSDWAESFEKDENGEMMVSKLPYIVLIIDELADLMMIAKKDVEISIARIAQKARAAGIHLVIATQRPSTDVVTGLLKANLPSRVSFQLASFVDSKTIIDRGGAERLLGQGDMLFIPPGSNQLTRLHGTYVADEEISKITSFLREQGEPIYRDEILETDSDEEDSDSSERSDQDALYDQAVDLVTRHGHASASFLQRHLKVGYNRAARLIETMESQGVVGPADGARPREVLSLLK